MLRFDANEEDQQLALSIVKRGLAIAKAHNRILDAQQCMMDIIACHMNGSPMRLRDWINADDYSFARDFVYVINNIDRNTGKVFDDFKLHYSEANKDRMILC